MSFFYCRPAVRFLRFGLAVCLLLLLAELLLLRFYTVGSASELRRFVCEFTETALLCAIIPGYASAIVHLLLSKEE